MPSRSHPEHLRPCPPLAIPSASADPGAGPDAKVLQFRGRARRETAFEAEVDAALAAMAAHRPSAPDELYDLVSRPLYALVLAITRDERAAEEATVATFAEIWTTSASRPPGAATAWVMDIACRSARSLPPSVRRMRKGRLSRLPETAPDCA